MQVPWEYKTLKFQTEFRFFSGTDFDAESMQIELNRLGEQGWEVASVCPIEKVKGSAKFVIAIMKRPKQ